MGSYLHIRYLSTHITKLSTTLPINLQKKMLKLSIFLWFCVCLSTGMAMVPPLARQKRADIGTKTVDYRETQVHSYGEQPSGAGCVIKWKTQDKIEHKDIITRICTTENVHTCVDKT